MPANSRWDLIRRLRVKQSNVKANNAVAVHRHAFFTTASDGDVPLNSKPRRTFPT